MGLSLAALGVLGGAAEAYNRDVDRDKEEKKERRKAERAAEARARELRESRNYERNMIVAKNALAKSLKNREINEGVDKAGGYDSKYGKLYYLEKHLNYSRDDAVFAINNNTVDISRLDDDVSSFWVTGVLEKGDTVSSLQEEAVKSPEKTTEVQKEVSKKRSTKTSNNVDYVPSSERPIRSTKKKLSPKQLVQANSFHKKLSPSKNEVSPEEVRSDNTEGTTTKTVSDYLGTSLGKYKTSPTSTRDPFGKNTKGVEYTKEERALHDYSNAVRGLEQAEKDGADPTTVRILKAHKSSAAKLAGIEEEDGVTLSSGQKYFERDSSGNLVEAANNPKEATPSGALVAIQEANAVRAQLAGLKEAGITKGSSYEQLSRDSLVLDKVVANLATETNIEKWNAALVGYQKEHDFAISVGDYQKADQLEATMGEVQEAINFSTTARTEFGAQFRSVEGKRRVISETLSRMDHQVESIADIQKTLERISTTSTTAANWTASAWATVVNEFKGASALLGMRDTITHDQALQGMMALTNRTKEELYASVDGMGFAGQREDAKAAAIKMQFQIASMIKSSGAVDKVGAAILSDIKQLTSFSGSPQKVLQTIRNALQLGVVGMSTDMEKLAFDPNLSPKQLELAEKHVAIYLGRFPGVYDIDTLRRDNTSVDSITGVRGDWVVNAVKGSGLDESKSYSFKEIVRKKRKLDGRAIINAAPQH